MKVFSLLTVMAALLLPAVSTADTAPIAERVNACIKFTMCNAQTALGDCTALPASGDELVVRVNGTSRLTFYGMQSTATTYSCNVISNDRGHDAATGVGFRVNTASITNTAPILSLVGLFDYVWVNCTAIDGGPDAATITMLQCSNAQ